MKSTIQKFSVDKNGNKKKATGTVNNIRNAEMYHDNLTIEVDGVSKTGKRYMTTMTLTASDSAFANNSLALQKLGFDGLSQLSSFGLMIMNEPKKKHYGIEIDGKYFFEIKTLDDLKNLCTFINRHKPLVHLINTPKSSWCFSTYQYKGTQ